MGDQIVDEEKSEQEKPEHKDQPCDPSIEVRFAFGPNGQYFIALSENERYQYNSYLSNQVAKHVTDIPFGVKLYAAAIAADGGIFIACKDSSDKPYWMQSGPRGHASAFELAYKKLFEKISSNHSSSLKDLSCINLTLGPNGSYFTRTKDAALWRDLPPDLEKEIEMEQNKGVSPRQVALGRNNSYVCLWSNDRWSYRLAGNFKDLIAKFNYYKKTDEKIAFVALDPYETDSWFLVDWDGVVSMSFRNMRYDNIDRIQEIALGYMQRRARKTGQTFTNQFTRGSNLKHLFTNPLSANEDQVLTITPDSNYDVPAPSLKMRLLDPLSNIRSATSTQPKWRQQFMAAGVVGLSTGAICRCYGLPLASAAISGVITAGAYTAGHYVATR